MNLYILRHGIAADRDAQLYPDDSKRPLTKEGIQKMRQEAKGIKAFGAAFDLILTSPYPRARQTAEIVAKAYRASGKIKTSKSLAPDGSYRALVNEIKAKYSKKEAILLAGHEPYLSGLISKLCVGDASLEVDLKKGGLALLKADPLFFGACAELSWLLTPKQLRMMG